MIFSYNKLFDIEFNYFGKNKGYIMKCWCPFGNNQNTFIKFINEFTKLDAKYIFTKCKGKYTSNTYPSSLLEHVKKMSGQGFFGHKLVYYKFLQICMEKSIQMNLEIMISINQVGFKDYISYKIIKKKSYVSYRNHARTPNMKKKLI